MGNLRKKIGRIFCSLAVGMLLCEITPLTGRADDVYTVVVKKQEIKQKNRWSLADWLETRDRMRLQDIWLAMHSPSPYEFYLGGNYQYSQTPALGNSNTWEAFFAAYATIFGLEFRYESGIERRVFGIFNLRIFGFHDQSTNITLQGGVRETQNTAFSFRNAFAGASITLYLARYFGIDGLYRYYIPSTPGVSGQVSGYRYQGGAFIDFRLIRVYGNYFYDEETHMTSSGATIGTKIYF
jgi:hypothetical protein